MCSTPTLTLPSLGLVLTHIFRKGRLEKSMPAPPHLLHSGQAVNGGAT